MNKKTVTSSLALLLLACAGAQTARAQDAAAPDASSQVSESQPPADGQPPATEAAPPPAESSEPPAGEAPSSEPTPSDANPYESSDASMPPEDTSASEEPAPPVDNRKIRLRWGAQLGYLFPTDAKPGFRAPKWMPIGGELGLGLGGSPFAVVFKADVSPLCFGGHDCSGTQVRGLAGLEVGIQKAAGSVLHMVYLNASIGYRYANAKIEDSAGSTKGGKLSNASGLMSEVSASMMVPVTRNFSLGPRVAISSNLTGNPKDGVSSLQLGVRVLHMPN
jgi:hypothetical protein